MGLNIHTKIKINTDRLKHNIDELAGIGCNEAGGIDRWLGSEADRLARAWLEEYWNSHFGKSTETDGIANMWMKRAGAEKLPPIMFGSHLDSVANGGKYDGALGVLLATEILLTIEENNICTRHPFHIVSFTGEEPNPYNVSTLGSKVITGRLKKEDLLVLKSMENGESLKERIELLGGDINGIEKSKLHPGDASAFLECHIEQGRNLFDGGLSVASVKCITGIYRENITINGTANHAGTTLMKYRQDALLAASEFNLAFERIIGETGGDELVGTIGQLNVFPNSVNIIPGRIELVMEIRSCDSDLKERVLNALEREIVSIEKNREVRIQRKINLDQPKIDMSHEVVKAVNYGIGFLNQRQLELVSMAGHDAANMARVTRSGMIFVQSIDGKSHCPEERTNIEDIETAGNAMLEALLRMDLELDG